MIERVIGQHRMRTNTWVKRTQELNAHRKLNRFALVQFVSSGFGWIVFWIFAAFEGGAAQTWFLKLILPFITHYVRSTWFIRLNVLFLPASCAYHISTRWHLLGPEKKRTEWNWFRANVLWRHRTELQSVEGVRARQKANEKRTKITLNEIITLVLFPSGNGMAVNPLWNRWKLIQVNRRGFRSWSGAVDERKKYTKKWIASHEKVYFVKIDFN